MKDLFDEAFKLAFKGAGVLVILYIIGFLIWNY